ncbi:hypothetical protein E3Z10_14785 [Escherichia albertii]|nr:hypothetical protein [Escherichia albertii]
MSVPVYQIMSKGCHRQDENMSFSPLLARIFCRSSGSLANHHVDNFVHKLFTSFLIYYHAFYRVIFIVVFHVVKIKFLANN